MLWYALMFFLLFIIIALCWSQRKAALYLLYATLIFMGGVFFQHLTDTLTLNF